MESVRNQSALHNFFWGVQDIKLQMPRTTGHVGIIFPYLVIESIRPSETIVASPARLISSRLGATV